MSNFSAVDSLGFKGMKQSRSWFRNILVLFQFSVSIFLIASTFLVQKQMHLIMEDSLGFDKEQVVLVKNAYYMKNLDSYEDELRNLPEVIAASVSQYVPGDKITNWGFGAEGVENNFSLNANLTDEDYIETMGMELVKGRYFSQEFAADTGRIVLNETAVALLEWEDPIGKITYLWGDHSLPLVVIGVVIAEHMWYMTKEGCTFDEGRYMAELRKIVESYRLRSPEE